MCSVDDQTSGAEEVESNIRSKNCMKCGEMATVVIRMNDPFCRTCFVAYVVHKFRAAIGKSKLIRDGENVLVALSGGPSSSCLLRLVKEGLGENVHKKLRFKPSLVFVDEGAAVGLPTEDRLHHYSQIKAMMVKSGFPGYITSLQARYASGCYDTTGAVAKKTVANEKTAFVTVTNEYKGDKLVLSEEADDKLKDLIGSVKSASEKENLIRIIRYHILLRLARQTGHTKVMCGDTASRLSVKLLTGIAQGRGGHIPFDTGFSDFRNPDVVFVRPLKDFTVKEVSVFNLYHDISPIFTPSLTTKSIAGSSIEHLTEEFVYGLQASYLATVSNITRTGEKLDHIEEDTTMDKECCALCQAPLDTNAGNSSALSALLFSQSLSSKPHLEAKPEDIESDSQQLSDRELMAGLCYGCRITANDMEDAHKLPGYVMTEIIRRKNRMKMKEEIADCLLATDDS